MEDILQPEAESLKTLEAWEPNSQQKITTVQSALSDCEKLLLLILKRFRWFDEKEKLWFVRVGTARLMKLMHKSYSTIRRTLNSLMAKGVITMRMLQVYRKGMETLPRLFILNGFGDTLDSWKRQGGFFVRRNRGVQIVKENGEPVEMKRPPLPPLVRLMVDTFQKARVAVQSALGSKPSKSLEELGNELRAKEKQARLDAITAKQKKIARETAARQRLNELNSQIQNATAGSSDEEREAARFEIVELRKFLNI